MIKIAKTIAVAVAVTCMFTMASEQASAQCARGGFGGFNSGFGGVNVGFNSGFRGTGFNSGFRGSGFNSGFGGVNRGVVKVKSVPFGGKSAFLKSSGFNRGRFGY